MKANNMPKKHTHIVCEPISRLTNSLTSTPTKPTPAVRPFAHGIAATYATKALSERAVKT